MSDAPRQVPPHETASASPADEEIVDEELARTLIRPIVFMPPDRMVDPPSWLEHVPFAFWLVDVLRPRVFVELGTHAGNSYGALAQAVQHLGLQAAGYAVDTWKGDPQAGFYDESVFTEWKTYHDRRYSSFSTLVRTTFDDAAKHFGDGEIDLLNIDGFHATEAVRHDFETWRPKMSRRGIVLMHDINVRERDFGAWQVWREIQRVYPTLEFLHGHGLGVVAVGPDIPAELEWLVGPAGDLRNRIVVMRRFFGREGSALLSQFRATAAERTNHELASRVEHEAAVRRLTEEITNLRAHDALLSDSLSERDTRVSALAAELSDAAVRVGALEAALTETARQRSDAEQRATEMTVESDRLRGQLTQAEAHNVRLAQDLSRSEAARNVLQTRGLAPAWPQAAAGRALAAANARLRALAATTAAGRVVPSRPARIAGTLQALGLTPRQLLRRPRGLGTLCRFMTRPRLLKDAHRIVGSGLFDAGYYLRLAPDVAAAGANPLVHFLLMGGAEGRPPCLLFDAAWYLEQYPDVAAAGANPLAHYLRTATREDRDPHPLFSAGYYRAQLGGRQGAGIDPLRHYIADGALEGRSPHPLFDPEYYLESCGGAVTGVNPFAHFLAAGAAAGFSPHPLFDSAYYRAHLPPHERETDNPLLHYLRIGTGQGRRPHPLFDPAYYRQVNADVRTSGVEPLIHYATAGGREGRLPLPHFDGAWYLAAYPDVAEGGTNPLIHYVRHGWLEGRNPSPHFETRAYLGRYPDVTRSGVNPFAHYLQCGMAEGRTGAPDEADRAPLSPAEPERVRLRASSLEAAPTATRIVVCLMHVRPVAPRAGNEYRIHRMLKWLRESGNVIIPILAPADGTQPGPSEVAAIAAEFGNAIVCLPDGRLEYVLRDVPDVLRSLDGSLTEGYAATLREQDLRSEEEREMLHIDRSFCSDALIATVLRLQAVLGRYVLLAEYIWMSRVLPLLDGRALKIIDTIDVFSTRHEKVGQFGVQDLVVERAAEAMRLRRGDVAIAIQHNERDVLEDLVPGLPVVTVGVDFDVLEDAAPPPGRHVLYVASDNPMNRHGLRDFLRHAWGRVRDAVPEAELMVVGAVGGSVPIAPAGVTVLGRVDDLAPLYRACRVVINPAVAGTGVKIKTLEALSHLRRVVAWPNGVDGLSPAVAALCRTATDWYSFSEQLVDLLTNDAAARLDDGDRQLLAREGSPAVVYDELRRVLDDFYDAAPTDVAERSSVDV